MPTMLPPDLEQFLQAEVASGKYVSADEAVVAGVRLLRDRERQREELRRELDVGLAALERGDVDRKSTRLNSSHLRLSRMPSSA